jgi:hypothetical protein
MEDLLKPVSLSTSRRRRMMYLFFLLSFAMPRKVWSGLVEFKEKIEKRQ